MPVFKGVCRASAPKKQRPARAHPKTAARGPTSSHQRWKAFPTHTGPEGQAVRDLETKASRHPPPATAGPPDRGLGLHPDQLLGRVMETYPIPVERLSHTPGCSASTHPCLDPLSCGCDCHPVFLLETRRLCLRSPGITAILAGAWDTRGSCGPAGGSDPRPSGSEGTARVSRGHWLVWPRRVTEAGPPLAWAGRGAV